MGIGELITAHPIPDAAYYIRNRATQKVLELTSSNAIFMQDLDDDEDDDSQKWIITKRGDTDKKKGIYSIVNLKYQNIWLSANKAVDARIEGKDTLVTWTFWISKNNTFVIGTNDPVYALNAQFPGSKVTLQEEAGTYYQQWEIIPATDSSGVDDPAKTTARATISTGQKYFIRNWHNSLLLSLGNKSVDSEATNEVHVADQTQKNIDPRTPVGQIWSVNHKDDDSYEIYNVAAGQYLAIANDSDTAYSDLVGSQEPTTWQIQSVGGFAWTITSENDFSVGFPDFVPRKNDKVFLVPNGITQSKIWFFEVAVNPRTDSILNKLSLSSRFNVTMAVGPWRLRHMVTDYILCIGLEKETNGKGLISLGSAIAPDRHQKWHLRALQKGTPRYILYNDDASLYGVSLGGRLATGDRDSVGWAFAHGPSESSYYISPSESTDRPRMVLGIQSLVRLPLVEFEEGKEDQIWIFEHL